jgi:hypothetical protein
LMFSLKKKKLADAADHARQAVQAIEQARPASTDGFDVAVRHRSCSCPL